MCANLSNGHPIMEILSRPAREKGKVRNTAGFLPCDGRQYHAQRGPD